MYLLWVLYVYLKCSYDVCCSYSGGRNLCLKIQLKLVHLYTSLPGHTKLTEKKQNSIIKINPNKTQNGETPEGPNHLRE